MITPVVIDVDVGSILPPGRIGDIVDIKLWDSVGRGATLCAAGPVGGLKGLAPNDGDTPAEDELAALGPVGIPLGPVGGIVGDTDAPGKWRGGMADQPPRPPRGAKPPPRGGTYPRGPDGGTVGL